MTAPARLRAEHLREAMGLAVREPRLSWTPPAATAGQTAYRIMADNGWDTGRIASAESGGIAYGGPALDSRSRFDWRVRTWNVDSDGTETASDWSESMPVELGLLHPSDWTGQWISPGEEAVSPPGERPGYALTRTFTLPAAPDKARAYATAHGIYELFINGQRVGDQQLTPGSTSYNTTLQVQAYDVTALLTAGLNTIRAVLTDGWYRGTFGYTRDADMYGTHTAFLAQLELESEAGRQVIGTDPSWLVSATEVISADLMAGQRVDFRAYDTGSAPSAGKAPGVRAAVVRPGSFGALTGPLAPPTRVTEELAPVSITRLRNGHQVVDFGQNIHGWVRLAALGGPGETVTLEYGEALGRDGDVTRDHLRPHDFRVPGAFLDAGQVDTVTASGAPGEVFEPRHTSHGFQFVSVRGLATDLRPRDVTACLVRTDLERIGTFHCSDERLNKLHGIVEWSFLGNSCEVPTDCPQREKAGWTGDWQLFVPTAAYLYDVTGFTRKWLRDVRADQWDNGVIANISPSPGPAITSAEFMGFTNGSSGWGDAIVMVPWEAYLATGDASILAENWDAMNRWLGFVRTTAETRRHAARATQAPVPADHEKYLWDTGFHFGEWMEPDGPGPDLFASRTADNGIVATAYYRHTTDLMARIARALGLAAEAADLARLSDAIRDAWATEYLDESGRVTVASQANCVRALAFQLAGTEHRAAVTTQLVELIRDAGTHLGTGFLATPYLLPVLADHGHLGLAYELLMQDSEPSWLAMVDRGATTVWELWNGLDAGGAPHQSLNHYSKGAVVSFLHRYTAGLRQAPGSAGWNRIIIEPRPGAGLTSAATSHQGPHGPITVAWTLSTDALGPDEMTADGVLTLTADIPSGTTAEILLPGQPAAVVGPGHHVFSAATGGDTAHPELMRSTL
ncbi:alpha-L-rhamnosidase [Pseudarthrobacter chlorophenolicus A6]|uniref:alpha-L-rhamnosidase n=1 Tax=Pseudarthrobacter chlorophenolicus (strain ATCC 700700 / DSM 12829 / CIP 107037 / JCM 12360 / KCTC 9906 / NCIMB 13794 / A6) TaxID=452863 RepID=B8HAH3_PSECP|nr:alpha-L-rhamnosidase [Pseudarthrobacter chlorophenolicus]ACL38434.1 alpha-L-rhamnosidase [Pseudarthrobacter chlorophenolicus A6]SDQ48923.1 alpha-L-rhamnosidase [Pseudarthrobacter chlorophenolicus]